ncbi:hypothetical protein BAUCODRAFT_527011 [Baudoinia panamericana UAMH 10762]|uniref:Ketoreductase (KR) domain-containing protein n=1 Tax=Baudoinia panamericana (strain UAMH 10762) TaxID=717646 RepID=M2N8H1_BAUPA|nr:uncharacterized protein BAUCODRAFT_527011 [Baudoinia panamericana UAMH 10762]EMC95125.1 hypothetical protein BAUCODRAFT_527011 [Baudoinia panamericana UAMH 10762]
MTDAQQLFDYARRQFNEIADDVERHFDMVAGSVGSFVYIRSNRQKRKRRVTRSASGARTDVVVVAGAVANPLASSLYLDLERRGFVVYVVTSTHQDEQHIKSLSRVDLVPLHIDLVDPFSARDQMVRFQDLLDREHQAFESAEAHRLSFAGLILVPDTKATPAEVGDISSEEWSDALNAKVLNTIATTQLFLPTVVQHKAKVMLLTPSVTPALRPPMHAIESTVYGALEGFTSSLAAELKQEGVKLSHFKLGNIDIPAVTSKQRREGALQSRLGATPLRTLQDSVFDALMAKRPRRTWHVGRGSLVYDVIGSWAPPTITAWMMGAGRRKEVATEVKDEDMHGSQGSLTWEKVEQEVSTSSGQATDR